MAHVYNDPADFKDEATAGFVAAYARYVEKVDGASAVMRRGGPRPGKVSVVIGGGSGHYPAFCGVVGRGLADGAVIGDIFTSPSNEQAYRTGLALDGGAGVLFSFGNYAGDVMNFGTAQERLRADGIDCRTVLVTDDVASADRDHVSSRRGVVGDFVVFKIAGAAADRGDSLDRVEELARKANARTVSFGVAFDGCTFPGRDAPLFHVEKGSMDVGLGIHGEPGIRTVPWMPAHELAHVLLEPLLAERPDRPDGPHRPDGPDSPTKVAVILNGLGATKYEELFVLWKTLSGMFSAVGLEPVLPEVGEIVTSLDMAGCSLTITWLDDELEELWCAPADTPAFRRGAVADLPQFEVGSSRSTATATTSRAAAAVPASAQSQEAAVLVRAAIATMLDVVVRNEDELGRIDAIAGDGDHGVGMVRGLRAANEAARQAESVGVAGVLTAAGAAWADRAGGSSGVLWGAILTAFGAQLGDQDRPDAARVAQAVAAGADALTRLGQCQVGDKTMYDALRPFADALSERVAGGDRLTPAWAFAAQVATDRAGATAALVPRLGRARPLAERSVGTPDAGATSMAMLLTAVGALLAEKTLQER
ncbi:dihydroxyacetone kinase family protein [Nakamurella sp. UYEF19]|uniref:dihydroxyacetone kinase family protein n=1 Tax=Nakamurella sp. UYEF19 TaxID=1756392 RepID=UPI003392B5CD